MSDCGMGSFASPLTVQFVLLLPSVYLPHAATVPGVAERRTRDVPFSVRIGVPDPAVASVVAVNSVR
jgi:hypothetical protein